MGTKLRIISIAALTYLVSMMLVASAYAEQYDVNAFVPYPTPTQAATIDSPATSTVFQDAQQTISGSCQPAAPQNVVSIWRSDQLLGSSACSGGVYTVPVILQIGQNELIARTANLNGIYGPDSTTISVTLETPTNTEPLPPSISEPTTTGQRTGAINQGGLSGLSLRTENPFSVLKSGNAVSVRVVVGGGKNPYTLTLNWGDGSTESHTIAQAGTYEFTHAYHTYKGYSVYIRVKDVLGSYTEYVYAVVASEKAPVAIGNTDSNSSHRGNYAANHWYLWLVGALLLFFLVSSYLLGWRRAKRKYEKKSTYRPAAKKKKATKGRK